MDGRTPHRLISSPRMVDVVGWMRRFAHGPRGKESLELRGLVEDIVRDVDSGDYAGEALACYYWVCRNIKYRKDITGVEFVKDPMRTLSTKCGDCDDIATLLAAMLMSIGDQCRFVLAGFVAGSDPTHVFCAVILPDGSAVPLDPVANRVTQQMMARTKVRKVINVGALGDETEDEYASDDLGYEDGSGGDPAAGRRVMRTFSVWDYPLNQYTYYEALAPPVPPTGGFRRARSKGSPEGIAAVLPAGARKTGTGARAKGTIATTNGSGTLGSVADALDRVQPKHLWLAGGATVAFAGLAWWIGRKKPRRAARSA